MFIQGNLVRESDVYVVATANLDQTVCYQLRLIWAVISESYSVYKTKLRKKIYGF